MPSDFALKTMNAVHRTILKVSGGRLGWSAQNMPVLELTTVGRTSGQPRKVMLTSPYQEGPDFVVVASRGGDDKHPSWFLNLREAPDVEVSVQGSPPQRMHARIAGPEPPLVLDVRSRSDYLHSDTRIPGSVRVLPDQVAEWADDQQRKRAVVAVCT